MNEDPVQLLLPFDDPFVLENMKGRRLKGGTLISQPHFHWPTGRWRGLVHADTGPLLLVEFRFTRKETP